MEKTVPLLCAAAASAVAFARQIDVPAQPMSPYADTEVSTNVVIHPSRTDVRDVKLHLQLDRTEGNYLEVGFGCDTNANGALDVEEVETVYGWRGGRCFIENVRTWERFETESSDKVQCGSFDVHVSLGSNSVPTRITAVCGGETAFAGFSTPHPPPWLYRNGWKMMRVVRRGADAPGERVKCEVGYCFLHVTVR